MAKSREVMNKVLALTRAGRVAQATRAIQQGLQEVKASPAMTAAAATAAPLVRWLDDLGTRVATRAPTGDRVADRASSATDARGAFQAASHRYAGMTRRYKLFVPSRPAPAPMLVVMLHGCTQDPDDFALGTGMNEHAERDGFLVLYPQQSRSDNPSACWNWFNRRDQRRDSGEAGFLADLVRTTVERHHVDAGRVYVAGLSAGGAMAEILAAEYPDLFAAAAIHSGLVAGAAGNVPDALNAMRSGVSKLPAPAPGTVAVPTIVLHGDADATVHPSNGEAIVNAVVGRSKLAATVEASTVGTSPRYTRTRHVLPDGSTLVEHWALHGAGHAWAGGVAKGSYTDPKGIDASDAIVKFFDRHRR